MLFFREKARGARLRKPQAIFYYTSSVLSLPKANSFGEDRLFLRLSENIGVAREMAQLRDFFGFS
jgi:hypothetical protein